MAICTHKRFVNTGRFGLRLFIFFHSIFQQIYSLFKTKVVEYQLVSTSTVCCYNCVSIFLQHIKYWMGEKLGWEIEEDSFEDMTPYHVKNFRNIIGKSNIS